MIQKTILKILICLFIFGFGFSGILSQVHSWPPGGLKPSPAFSKMQLPSNRFIPSSRRWNLVWADQIIPENNTSAEVAFAANNFIGTQKIFQYQADTFRTYNPNFLVLMYHLAAGVNPGENDYCPDPKTNHGSGYIGVVSPKGYVSEWFEYFLPWVTGQKLNLADYEKMFQHYDTDDSLHRVWHYDPFWLMDLRNNDWLEYTAYLCLDWMYQINDGCFFDVAVEANAGFYNPNSSDPSPNNFNWWQPPHNPTNTVTKITDLNDFYQWMNGQYLQFFQNVYTYFHNSGEGDFLVIPNVDQMATTLYEPIWLDGNAFGETIDGAMMENFGNYTGSDMLLSLQRGFNHITSRKKILIAQFSDTSQAERLRRTAMYMLVKNDNSYLNIVKSNKIAWYPEYEIDLGDAASLPDSFDLLKTGSGSSKFLLKRSYDSGMVVCNTFDTAISYNPYGEGWAYLKTSGGGNINPDGSIQPQSLVYIPFTGKITINPSQCLVLKKVDSSANYVSEMKNDEPISFYPNPAQNTLNIYYRNNSNASVEICIRDILGTEFKHKYFQPSEAQVNNFKIDISDLQTGLYFCTVKNSLEIQTFKFLKY